MATAPSKGKKRHFDGMNYREVQRSNSSRRSRLPKKEQGWLKSQGYKNVGWDRVIALCQKLNELVGQPDEEDSLEALFLKAERIGNKYQTPAEIAEFNTQLSAEASAIAEIVDRQFPQSEPEIVDYSGRDRRSRHRGR